VPDLTLSFSNQDVMRLKMMNERRGITGTNAEHVQEIQRLCLDFLNRMVKSAEDEAVSEVNSYSDLDAS